MRALVDHRISCATEDSLKGTITKTVLFSSAQRFTSRPPEIVCDKTLLVDPQS